VIAPLLSVRGPRHGGRPLEYDRGLVPDTILYVLLTERAELVGAAGNADGRGFQVLPPPVGGAVTMPPGCPTRVLRL
jgi:hypothetical protein